MSLLTGWLLFLALVVACGAVAGRWVILPGALEVGSPSPSTTWLQARVARIGLAAGLILPLAMGLVFVRQLGEFRDPFAPWLEDTRLLLTGTSWGTIWLLGAVASVAALAGFLAAAAGRRPGWWLATASSLALGAFPAFTGHASGTEGLRAITLAADTLHVWAAGGWIGGLTVVLYLEYHWRRESSDEGASLLPRLVPAFSPLAIVCVGALVATGAFASWVHLPTVDALWTTSYGRLLVMKLLLVGGVLALGALNWRRLAPKLADGEGDSDLRRAASVELLIAHVVIALTAVLVRSPPAG